jgi:hypothetical protein
MSRLLSGLVLVALSSSVVADPLADMQAVYCYTFFGENLRNQALSERAIESSKAAMAALLPKYQEALENARGTAAEVLLKKEEDRATSARSGRMSITELRMVASSCNAMVTTK